MSKTYIYGKNNKSKLDFSINKNVSRKEFASLKKEYESLKNLLHSKFNQFEQNIEKVEKRSDEIYLPVSIFKNNKLGILEITVKYLKDFLKLNISEISRLLNRDYRTVWDAHQNSADKKIFVKQSKINVRVSIFEYRLLAPLETLVVYLKDNENLKFVEISRLLDRAPNTIWTTNLRARKKLKHEK